MWLAGIVLVNVLVHFAVVRYDMTDDKRYSLSPQTKQLLRGPQEPIIVVNYLDGELNAGFTRLKKAVEETVEEMAVYGDIRRLAPNDEDIWNPGCSQPLSTSALKTDVRHKQRFTPMSRCAVATIGHSPRC